MAADHSQADLAARADLCRLLAASYYEPDPAFEQARMFDSMQAAAAAVDQVLTAPARRLAAEFAAAPLQDLRIDYTRLFIGPQRPVAPPYGSMWLEPGAPLMQDSTLEVERLYAEAGYQLADDFRELPDHIAAELEFCYVLLFGEAQAERAGDAAAGASRRAWRHLLLDRHLGRWYPAFCDALAREAGTGFYRELAALTAGFLASERVRARD